MKPTPNTIKNDLTQYGQIVETSDFRVDQIKQTPIGGIPRRPLYFIRESDLTVFRNDIQNQNQTHICSWTKSCFEFQTSGLSMREKDKDFFKAGLCVEDRWFVPYRIYNEKILFFYHYDNQKNKPLWHPVHGPNYSNWFLVVKDSLIHNMLAMEHVVLGVIDVIDFKILLASDSNIITNQMRNFKKSMAKIAKEHPQFQLLLVGDSVILKNSFKLFPAKDRSGIVSTIQAENFKFEDSINVFKKIRSAILDTFDKKCYGVFTYGENKIYSNKKSAPMATLPPNLLCTDILSFEFENLLRMEKICREASKTLPQKEREKIDLYIDCDLQWSFHSRWLNKSTKEGRPYPELIARRFGFDHSDTSDVHVDISVDDNLFFSRDIFWKTTRELQDIVCLFLR